MQRKVTEATSHNISKRCACTFIKLQRKFADIFMRTGLSFHEKLFPRAPPENNPSRNRRYDFIRYLSVKISLTIFQTRSALLMIGFAFRKNLSECYVLRGFIQSATICFCHEAPSPPLPSTRKNCSTKGNLWLKI